ncbi:STAS domain-containing protein [Hymenobacter metallilatus]|uniref:STAS domain-containing protein n=1 Tax=Hymenobacter metallilatus TaxID=2493666 RepID=A0A428JT81_9BACT|nr:STAS domain-containing protein [Hymenobacter metallilatus]RSK37256.1 STAS domain-containing protein [Hymenobacter metallilatus]
MEVYREILPNSYLLILTEDQITAAEVQLTEALRVASRSGKPSIWVDCSQLHTLSFAALRVLARTYRRLRRRQVQLVLCHLGNESRQLMAKLPTALCPPVVPSLLDAERYCQHPHPLIEPQRLAS